MNDARRRHIHGRLQPMDTPPPAGPASLPPGSQAGTRIAIALAIFWLAVAILYLKPWSH